MSFNRNRGQIFCEALPGCDPNVDSKRARNNFQAYTLSKEEADSLRNHLLDDAMDFYYKGILSFCEAVNAISSRSLYSWATVKLYYSVYYLLRASLSTKDIALIRIRELYYLRSRHDEQPQKISGKAGNSTHQGTIKIFQQLFQRTDILQTNTIDGLNSYTWLMERRDQINYREREFHDPNCSDFWQEIANAKTKGRLSNLLTTYASDSRFIYCFQADHACLALPIQRILLTKQDLINEGITTSLPNEQKSLLEDLLVNLNAPVFYEVVF